MDYPYGEFDDCSYSRFGFIVRIDRQTASQNHTHDDRYTHSTPVSVSNDFE